MAAQPLCCISCKLVQCTYYPIVQVAEEVVSIGLSNTWGRPQVSGIQLDSMPLITAPKIGSLDSFQSTSLYTYLAHTSLACL